MIALWALTACSKPAAPTDATETRPAPEPAAASGPVGTWTSAPCEGRDYVREYTIAADGTVTIHDRISPCPEDATCVWSGIVTRTGAWSAEGNDLVLSLSDEQPGPGTPPPARLTRSDSHWLEASSDCRLVQR